MVGKYKPEWIVERHDNKDGTVDWEIKTICNQKAYVILSTKPAVGKVEDLVLEAKELVQALKEGHQAPALV